MLHTKFRGNRLAASGEEDFEGFLPYMGVAARLIGKICSNMYKMVGGLNLYRPKTSLASRSSSGFDRSLKNRNRFIKICLRRRSCLMCAAILVVLMLSKRRCLLKILTF